MKRLIVFIILFIVALSFSQKSCAQCTGPSCNGNEVGKANESYATKGDISNPVHIFGVKNADAYWFTCNSIGFGCVECADPKKQQCQEAQNQSFLGKSSAAITYLYQNQPAETSQFIAYYGQKMGIVKPAYAQGIGFSGLSPLMGLWQGFRNIAYGFLILVLVVIGFMILFRTKIDPRTVISVQNAIPRIIITLFLITFSYAIVGLLIDIMYILMSLSIIALSSMVPFNSSQQGNIQTIISQYTGGNIINLISATHSSGLAGIKGLTEVFWGAGGTTATLIITTVAGIFLAGKNIVGQAFFGILNGAGLYSAAQGYNPLIWLLVSLAIIFTSIRIFVMLLNAYISILISLIFGPLQIMLGAIPNSNAFSSWFRNLIANIVIFPITAVLLIMGTVVSAIALSTKNPLWTPPGLSGVNPESVAGILSLGFTFIIPSIAGAIKEALKAKPMIPTGTASLFQPITSVYGEAMQGVSQMYYLKQMFGKH